jgi:hypothetical protein
MNNDTLVKVTNIKATVDRDIAALVNTAKYASMDVSLKESVMRQATEQLTKYMDSPVYMQKIMEADGDEAKIAEINRQLYTLFVDNIANKINVDKTAPK